MTTRLVPLEDAEIELIKEEFSDYEPDIDYFTGKTITYPEREKLFKKLQACLKGEAGISDKEMKNIWIRLFGKGNHNLTFKECGILREKLKGYLGECE